MSRDTTIAPTDVLPGTVQALWGHWEAQRADHPQYDHWRDEAVPCRITRRIGGGDTFVRAEPGDLALVITRTDLSRRKVEYIAYCPRVGWNVLVRAADFDTIIEEIAP